jgi:hypothetical protein
MADEPIVCPSCQTNNKPDRAVCWKCGTPFSTDLELHEAAMDGDLGRAEELMRTAPDSVRARDGSGRTPLHIAAWKDQEAIVSALLKNGADVDAHDNSGRTPLHFAAEYGNTQIELLLPGADADLEAVDNAGKTAIYRAVANGHEDAAKLLLEMGSRPPDMTARAVPTASGPSVSNPAAPSLSIRPYVPSSTRSGDDAVGRWVGGAVMFIVFVIVRTSWPAIKATLSGDPKGACVCRQMFDPSRRAACSDDEYRDNCKDDLSKQESCEFHPNESCGAVMSNLGYHRE